MKLSVIVAFATTALAQTAPPPGCQATRSGTFNVQTVNVTRSASKRGIESRQLAGALTLNLNNGILKDQAGRQGYIASNYQLQYDSPLQAGARESTGFSVCSNGSLALSASGRASPAVWYSCLSGTFYNLYSQSIGAQCIPTYIVAVASSGSGGASQISDGQPQAPTPRPVSQISDGQPQAGTPRPSLPVVSQISDGQPQAGTPRPTSRPAVVSQISDGQPQAPRPTGPVVSQISDGQPQAPRPTSPAPRPSGPVVSQISDGQPQAPRPTGPVVSQISDGQPQAPRPTGNATRPNATAPAPSQFTGAAGSNTAVGGLVAGLLALFAML